MTVKEAITLFGYHQRSNLKPRTLRNYQPLLQRLEAEFGERSFDSIGSDEIFQFLEKVAGDCGRIDLQYPDAPGQVDLGASGSMRIENR